MKMTTLVPFGSHLYLLRPSARRFCSSIIPSAFLMMIAALLSLGGVIALGQPSNCPPGSTGPNGYFEAPGIIPVTFVPTITPGPTFETTYSFGIFQICFLVLLVPILPLKEHLSYYY